MLALLTATAATAVVDARADEVLLLDGRRVVDVLAIERSTKGLEVVTADERIAGDAVRELRFADPVAPPGALEAVVLLRGGDRLYGALLEGPEDAVSIASPTLGQLVISLDLVRAVAFTTDARALERLADEHLGKDLTTDRCVLSSWATRAGTVESVGPKGVAIELEGVGVVALSPDRLVAVQIAPLGPAKTLPPEGRARLDLACGSAITATLHYLRAGFAGVDTTYVRAVRIPARQIAAIYPESDRFRYVSDLTPVEVEERSEVIGIVFPHRKDGSVAGGPLAVGGTSYRKGIGVKAHTRLVYVLDGRDQRLRAMLGLDDTARRQTDVDGTVRFQVLADGKPLLGPDGILLTSRDAPRPIDLELQGAKRLELLATFGPSGDVLARGAWADAYLVR